ncbi:HNH endonuclease [Mesobacillus subterraneus]|uniref:Putative HNH nuclease YajD n=1 Tax=Mesobacillus subterraneus TaxID=285983 RepID=A0A3R9KNQ9_9BACI|nr:HNH endonuclease signature motif containing protein [Mesobacillus subterraneus]RSD21067.1 HNH endonuclease [Mesobacillus subterraneus]
MKSHYAYDKHKRNRESRAFYKSTAWEKCRQLALTRDNYLCQDCFNKNIITSAEMVHHIEALADHPEKALDLDNLVSLCHPCHNKRHPDRAKKNVKRISNKIRVIKSKPNPEVT